MIVSITHGEDIDGIGAQAILLRYFKLKREIESSKIVLEYAHYSNLLEKLNRLLKNNKNPEELYISDLGFNKQFSAVFPIFHQLKNLNCKIYWFDHHIVEKKIKRRLKDSTELYLNDEKRCGAEILKDYYLPEDEIANKIALYARDRDFQLNKIPLAKKLDSLIAFYRGEEYIEQQKKLVKLMSKGVFENKWIKDQLIQLKVLIKAQKDLAVNRVKLIEIEDFGQIVVTFAELGASQITRYIETVLKKPKLFASIDSRHNEINIHSQYANCRNIAAQFNGGGHLNRAGFSYENAVENDKINQKFLDELIGIIKENKL